MGEREEKRLGPVRDHRWVTCLWKLPSHRPRNIFSCFQLQSIDFQQSYMFQWREQQQRQYWVLFSSMPLQRYSYDAHISYMNELFSAGFWSSGNRVDELMKNISLRRCAAYMRFWILMFFFSLRALHPPPVFEETLEFKWVGEMKFELEYISSLFFCLRKRFALLHCILQILFEINWCDYKITFSHFHGILFCRIQIFNHHQPFGIESGGKCKINNLEMAVKGRERSSGATIDELEQPKSKKHKKYMHQV